MRSLALAALIACGGPRGRVCTLELRTISVDVVDASGAPVYGLATRTVLARTGRVVHQSAPRPAPDPAAGGVPLHGYELVQSGEIEASDVYRFEILDTPVRQDFRIHTNGCHPTGAEPVGRPADPSGRLVVVLDR